MPAFNRVTLVGNLTADVRLSYTPKQTAVADVGIAVNEKWTAADGTEREDVLFIDIRAYGRRAEVMAKYLKKGSLLLVDGKLRLERWEDQQGGKHSKHGIVADQVTFLTPNGSRVESGRREPGDDHVPC